MDVSIVNLHEALADVCRVLQTVFITKDVTRPSVALHPGKTVITDSNTLSTYVTPYLTIAEDSDL